MCDRLAARYGLSLTWDSLSLSLHRGLIELEGVVLERRADADADREGEGEDAEVTPYLELEYARADVRVLALLTGRMVLHRLEADGVRSSRQSAHEPRERFHDPVRFDP